MSDNPHDKLRADRQARMTKAFSPAGVMSMFVISILLGISGPFGTFIHGDFGDRLVYWTVLVVVSWVLAELIMVVTDRVFAHSLLVRETAAISVFTALFTPFLIGWTVLVLPSHAANLFQWAVLAAYVFAISVVISVIRHGIPYWMGALYGPAREEEAATRPARLLRRLPDGFEGEVLRISADGHRVEVVTNSARFELRMRLADAVDEMRPVEGLCVHRSHWVAAEAVRDVVEAKGRPVLVLKNGDEVPVGAKYQPALEDAGWLADLGIGTAQA